MIKLVMCLTRHSTKSRQQFQDYWLNSHGPFFMKHAADMRAKKYVQSLTIDTPANESMRQSRGMLPEFDGVAEVWFESEEDMMAGMSSAEGQKLAAALLEDERTFIDHAKSSAFLVSEHELT
ncbi:MAG: EthD domain-containing protein [Planctomycetota bacterium]